MSAVSSPLVWITRAEPGAAATAARVAAAGWTPLVAPLLAARPLADARLDLTGVGALAFTSAGGVRAFTALHPAREAPVFTVGEATAAAARSAGFTRVASAGGDVRALAALIIARRAEIEGQVLHPGAAILAGDLVGELTAAAVEARAVALYETLVVDPSDQIAPVLHRLEAVLVHSPRAGEALAAFLARRPAPHLRLAAISAAAAAPLATIDLKDRLIANHPDEAGLLQALGDAPV